MSAPDFNKPLLTSTYTDVINNINDNINALVKGLDLDTINNAPVGAIKFDSASSSWKKYNGSSWVALASTYNITVANATNAVNAINATNASSVAWSGITSKPSTISGYGITDMSSQSVDAAAQIVTSAFSLKEVAGLLSIYNGSNQRITFDSSGSPTFLADTVRFKANFSDSTQSKIASFQTKTTNGVTNLQALPDGSGAASSFTFFNASDDANASQIKAFISATKSGLNSFKTGTGTVLPVVLQVAGVDKLTLSADGATTILSTTNLSDGTTSVALASLLASVNSFTATGGAVTTIANSTIHTFLSSSNFVTGSIAGLCDILIVGGGGGGGGSGGFHGGGGGGGGGVIYLQRVLLSASTTYAVVIGAGGNNANGGNSTFFGFTAIGGGRGGDGANPIDGSSGGCGGGGCTSGGAVGGNGTIYQGSDGAPASSNGGCGGGASSSGTANIAVDGLERSKNGFQCSISGTNAYYGGGGGGGEGGPGQGGGVAGGLGGGGKGGNYGGGSPNAIAGTANTGGGGGGGTALSSQASGGSGIVIVRYYK